MVWANQGRSIPRKNTEVIAIMATFKYTARDQAGNQNTGVLAAKDAAEVRELLRHKSLFPTSIKEQAAPVSGGSSFGLFRRRKVKLGDMVVMSRQLATLVRAGISIVQCLHDVAEQTDNP